MNANQLGGIAAMTGLGASSAFLQYTGIQHLVSATQVNLAALHDQSPELFNIIMMNTELYLGFGLTYAGIGATGVFFYLLREKYLRRPE